MRNGRERERIVRKIQSRFYFSHERKNEINKTLRERKREIIKQARKIHHNNTSVFILLFFQINDTNEQHEQKERKTKNQKRKRKAINEYRCEKDRREIKKMRWTYSKSNTLRDVDARVI